MLNIRQFSHFFALFLLITSCSVRADVQALLQMVDYMGVDYPSAVEGGQIVNEFEYAEMVEFAERILGEINQLEPSPALDDLIGISSELSDAVMSKAQPFMIAAQTQALRRLLMSNYDIELTPRLAPDLARAEQLYMDQCASCHGESGRGDGPISANMEPAPTDFHDLERAMQRSVFGLYNTITLGVEGTSMTAWPNLDDDDRWGLAFYVGSLIEDQDMISNGEQAWNTQALDLTEAVTLSPSELTRGRENGDALAFWIRKFPENLFAGQDSPLNVSRELLAASLQSYFDGNQRDAQEHAITAYLEGFELIEAPLSNVDADLMRRAEAAMIGYRQAIAGGVTPEELQSLYDNVINLLNESDAALSGDALSPSVAFTGSLIILLREGLEIILVLAAIFTFLVKSERQDALKYVHAGWIAALVAGVGTWAVSSYLFTISGATREITEGVTALIAAAILMYVGFWMHRNANAKRWAAYIKSQLEQALDAKTLWTLAIVSFLAVYREIFEIILFYQALWAQVNADAHSAVFYGAGLAIVMLVLTTWVIYKFGMKLPLSTFFNVSAVLLVLLAFIFAGKGIAALQEAGRIASTPVPGPTIDLLGIYPNVQALGLQAVVIILTLVVIFYEKIRPGSA
jgi:high-affinity iron transporter